MNLRLLLINVGIGVFYLFFIYLIYAKHSGGDMLFLVFSSIFIVLHFIIIWFKKQSVKKRLGQTIGIFALILIVFLTIAITNKSKKMKDSEEIMFIIPSD